LFNLTGGNVGAPFELRVTSIYDEVITFPTPITEADLKPVNIIDSKQQFAIESRGADECQWPGAPDDVYVDSYGGVSFLAWRFWGGDPVNEVCCWLRVDKKKNI
jgi:hypothetical protein